MSPAGPEPAALEAALRQQARHGQPIAYLALAELLQLTGPHRIHRLTLALEQRLRLDHAAGRPLLAALAIGRLGLPGRGYFQLLQELGRYDGPDAGPPAAARHAADLAAALDHWGSG